MATRIHIVLPTPVVEEIDDLVGPRKRSEFMARAAENELARERQLKLLRVMKETAGSLNPDDYPEWSTPEKTSEWVRRSRQLDNERLEELLERWNQQDA